VKEEPKKETNNTEEVKVDKEQDSEPDIVQVKLSWGGSVYLNVRKEGLLEG